jgi:hypothetical protein
LFNTSAAFADAAIHALAKLSIFVASMLAAGLGTTLLHMTSPKHEGTTAMQPASNPQDLSVRS